MGKEYFPVDPRLKIIGPSAGDFITEYFANNLEYEAPFTDIYIFVVGIINVI